MRARLAPSAVRTAISRSRVLARASSRFVTLTQEISSTNATADAERDQRRLDAGGQPLLDGLDIEARMRA